MDDLQNLVDAFKIPLLTSVFTIIAILLKDYISTNYQKKKDKENRSKSIRKYSFPIHKATSAVYWRIREIYSSGYEFLRTSAPKNKFNSYKYISSIYRLMVLIGWIRVIEKELTYIQLTSKEKYDEIEECISHFKSVLSDGERVEFDRIKHICKHWNLNISDYDFKNARKFGTQMEKLMWKYFEKYSVNSALDLPNEIKDELNQKIVDSANSILKIKIDKRLVKSRKDKILNEIKRLESWIYRDWQIAIGDYMIVNQETKEGNYELMSFGDFETEFNNRFEGNRGLWICRIESIFEDLNPKIEEKYDSRIQQLKNIGSASLDIIEAFNNLNKDFPIIEIKKIKEMREYDMNFNVSER